MQLQTSPRSLPKKVEKIRFQILPKNMSEDIRELTARNIGQTLERHMGYKAGIGQTMGRHWADIEQTSGHSSYKTTFCISHER